MSARRRDGLKMLYGSAPGRCALKVLTAPILSRAVGATLSTKMSSALVPGFIRRNAIDMTDFPQREYGSFNDFFTRRLRSGAREIDMAPQALVAPCDGRLSVFTIANGNRFEIKGGKYDVPKLLGRDDIELERGLALVFRLCVDDYHRYCYFDGCKKGENVFIPGALHTVRPQALEKTAVFTENCREYTVMRTDNFGTAVQVEVGAMMVGKIKNLHESGRFERGQEKGMFEFGGSTVVLLLGGGAAILRDDIAANIDSGGEIQVRLGERIGRAQGGL